MTANEVRIWFLCVAVVALAIVIMSSQAFPVRCGGILISAHLADAMEELAAPAAESAA
jgi:hypothetical protein